MINKLATPARYLLGVIYFVFGLNGFLQFIPQPPLPDAAGSFMGALGASGYFFPVLKGAEVIAGFALLSNRFVPLALLILAPITLQIVLFHAFLAPGLQPTVMSVVMVVSGLLVAKAHSDKFGPILKAI